MHSLSLAPLSVLPCGPIEQLEVASVAAFDMVGMRLCPVSATDPRIMDDAVLRRTILARLRETSVQVLDIEVVRVGPALDVASLEPVMEFGATLGARFILCTLPLHDEGSPADEGPTIERLVALCERTAQFGIKPVLEFMKFRRMATLDDAVRIAQDAAHPNLGICVDALHLARSGGTPEQVAALPRAWLPYCQLCDAPKQAPPEDRIPYEARFERLSPGRGELPLVDLLRALPQNLPLSIEVPDVRQNAAPIVETVARLAEDTRKLVASILR